MDEFDYLNGTLTEWLSLQPTDAVADSLAEIIEYIEDWYLPAFESAVWHHAAEVA